MQYRRPSYLFATSLSFLIIILLTACSTQHLTSIPTEMIIKDSPVLPATSHPTFLPTLVLPTITPTSVPPTATNTALPLPCEDDICVFPGHFIFQPPIDPDHNQKVEPSYLYGGTQDHTREPHHGVEFINPQGTPVLAAGDGEVVFAGNDSNVEIGWWVNFYGNLVVIQHTVKGFDVPIYTLYGHLSKILINNGDSVKAGDKIGEVGKTGKALGSHLHFEVREGINDYSHTRNPELWLIPQKESGVLVGQIFNQAGVVRRYPDFKLISLDTPEIILPKPVPYADSSLNGDDKFQEVFAVANLTPGKYELRFSPNGKTDTVQFEIFPGSVTRVTFHTTY